MHEKLKKVLIASDDKLWLKSASLALSENGFLVDIAEDGNEAENKLIKNPYSIAVLDIYMRIKPATNILSSLRGSGISTPILILSGSHDENEKRGVLTKGAVGFFVKPNIEITSLPDLLERYLD